MTKNNYSKSIGLIIAVIIIIGIIWYIEAHKPASVTSQSVAITVPEQIVNSASTTSDISSQTQSVVLNARRAAELKQEASEYSPAVEIIPGGDSSATGVTPDGAPASSGFI